MDSYRQIAIQLYDVLPNEFFSLIPSLNNPPRFIYLKSDPVGA
nr:MAG TPA: hypothetical protein [Siphoviridae sp. ct2ef27]